MNGGKVVFDFTGDTKDLDKKTNGLSDKFKSLGKTLGTAITSGVAVASTALGGLVIKGVSAAGELEQQIGGTEAVFGKFAETVQKDAAKAFETAGISANDYMAYANKIGSLMKGSGIETEQAMNLSAQAMQRASDVASIMGIDVNSAMEAITGAAKGNFTMMDNLGVAMNATSLEAYAMSKGIKKSYTTMSQAEKVGLAYEMFLEKTADYAGNYSKENETFAGSFNTLKAATTNFISGSGGIEDVLDSLNRFGSIAINSVVQVAPQIVNGVVALVNNIATQLPTLLNSLLPTIVNGAVSLITGLSNALPTLIPVLMQGLTTAIKALAPVLPQILTSLLQGTIILIQGVADEMPVLIPVIIQAILDMIPVLLDNLPLFISAGIQLLVGIAQGLINAIPILLAKLPTIIGQTITTLLSMRHRFLSTALDFMVSMATGMVNGIPKLVAKMPQIINSIVKGLKDGIGKIKDVGGDLMKGLWNGINDKKDWVLNKVKGVGSSILKGVKGIFGIHSPSKEFAIIGEYNMLGLEKGMQDMAGDVQKDINGMFDLSPNVANSSSLHMSPSVNVVVNNEFETDPLGQVVNNIKTFSGGAKNDYNYGQGV